MVMISPTPISADIERVVYTEAQIGQRVQELGAQLSSDYAGRMPLLVGVFAGATLFLADLVRALDPTLAFHLDMVGVSSYGNGMTTNGQPTITQMPEIPIFNRDVVLVEDIIDSGLTIRFLREQFSRWGARSVRVCALLDKQPQLCRAGYLGFACDPVFVVGYGLDYAEAYRGLPYIGVLKPSIYQEA
jgi:hypoxanthine phosphoribosyltransferase